MVILNEVSRVFFNRSRSMPTYQRVATWTLWTFAATTTASLALPLIAAYNNEEKALEHFSGVAVYIVSTSLARWFAILAFAECYRVKNDIRRVVLALLADFDPILPMTAAGFFVLHLLLYCSCGTTVAVFEILLGVYDTSVIGVLGTMM
ncbi:hypothetical protein MTO96_039608 [Rhipicephalus appendiculatus]